MTNVEIRKEKTSMELLEKVLSGDNIYEAYKKVYSNKGASGVDGVTVDELKEYLKYHLNLFLISRLLHKSFLRHLHV